MGGGLWCRQAQNGVNLKFQVKFDHEGQGRSICKIKGTLTKVFTWWQDGWSLTAACWPRWQSTTGVSHAYLPIITMVQLRYLPLRRLWSKTTDHCSQFVTTRFNKLWHVSSIRQCCIGYFLWSSSYVLMCYLNKFWVVRRWIIEFFSSSCEIFALN